MEDPYVKSPSKYHHLFSWKPYHAGNIEVLEYFFIRDDLFNRILETDQNPDIALKVVCVFLATIPCGVSKS